MSDSSHVDGVAAQPRYCARCGATLEDDAGDAELCPRCGSEKVGRLDASPGDGSANTARDEFQAYAAEERIGLVAEFWGFLKHNKKWWMLPILVVLLGFGVLVLLSGTAAAPFIYTLF